MLLSKLEPLVMTDNEHRNEQFRAWVTFKPDAPHYNNKTTRIAWFEWQGDWHK